MPPPVLLFASEAAAGLGDREQLRIVPFPGTHFTAIRPPDVNDLGPILLEAIRGGGALKRCGAFAFHALRFIDPPSVRTVRLMPVAAHAPAIGHAPAGWVEATEPPR
ncbi:MAG: hypothetical protein WBV82_02560 [Myxococcaceae bacterium]